MKPARLFTVRTLAAAAALTLGLVATGCGGAATPTSSGSGAASTPGITGSITVLAAASLTESFDTLGSQFEAAHPGTEVTFSYGSSATLATQITNGAPADVFAAASEKTMKTVTDAGGASDPTIFVTNTLEIAVPPGNPGGVGGLQDFADQGKRIVLCDKTVPCGAAAEQVFALTKITPKPDSYETDVKAALQKVELDEADAALVYKTDVISAGDKVEGVEFPESSQVVNSYPIAPLAESKNAATAKAFVDYVLSDDGRAVLSKAGFGNP